MSEAKIEYRKHSIASALLKLATYRVEFVSNLPRACLAHGVFRFVRAYPNVWSDLPEFQQFSSVTETHQHSVKAACQSLALAAFQNELIQALSEADIRVLALKGISIAHLLYGDAALRPSSDVDLLVPQGDVSRALQVCQGLGLREDYPAGLNRAQKLAHHRYGKAQTLVAQDGRKLDLHWRPFSPWVGEGVLDFENCWERSQVLEKCGLKPWRTLGNDHTIVFLALHAAQDGWSSLRHLLDLSLALALLDYSWYEVLEEARFRRPLLGVGVELCSKLMGLPVPQVSCSNFESYDDALAFWLKSSRAKKTPQFRLLSPHLWSCGLAEAGARSFRCLLNPAIDDIQALKLPDSLISLYPLVRFCRLFLKAWTRQ